MYTRNGDAGLTTINRNKVKKSTDIISTVGTIDTTLTYICDAKRFLCKNINNPSTLVTDLDVLIKLFYKMGSIISGYIPYNHNDFDVKFLEKRINEYMLELPELKNFILPCQSETSAVLDKCRVHVRSLELVLWKYTEDNQIENEYEDMLIYINRLSSYFFTISRLSLKYEGYTEIYLKDIS